MRINDKPLAALTDAELEAELERRRKARGATGGGGATRRRAPGTRRGARRRSGRHPGWKVRQWYRNLELKPGASRDEVELAYVRLSEKYHPDRHETDDKKRLARQLAAGLREAYRGILESLEDEEAERD